MSGEEKRKIKLEVRKNLESPDSKFMIVLLGPEAKKIRDLVDKVRLVCPRIQDTDEVEVYQDKYLLPHDEEIGLINTQEDVIIIPISNLNNSDVVVKEEYFENDIKPEINIGSLSKVNKVKKEMDKRGSSSYHLRCSLCRKTFPSEYKLLMHQKIYHKYKCEQCSRSYILNPDLLHHILKYHDMAVYLDGRQGLNQEIQETIMGNRKSKEDAIASGDELVDDSEMEDN